ncbi:MAG: LysR family transcriptional regulator [Acidobacteriota bacterium]
MRDLNAVDLNLLVALDALLELRSVRGAARRLHITPPAMSHKLRRIRKLIGDDLLVRAGRGLVATPRAEALAEPVRALLHQTRDLLADPESFSAGTLRRAFRIVCTDHISTILLPHVERLLAEEAPGVDIYVCPVLPEMMDQLRSGAVDVAIRVVTSTPPEMQVRPLFEDRHVTVARFNHPRIPGPDLSLEAYLAEQHVLVAPGGTPTGPIDELLEKQGLRRRVARTRPNFLSALWLVAESDALLTVSRRFVEATAARFDLTVLPTPLPVQDYALSMLWHPRTDSAREEAWFRDVLRRAAEAVKSEDGR